MLSLRIHTKDWIIRVTVRDNLKDIHRMAETLIITNKNRIPEISISTKNRDQSNIPPPIRNTDHLLVDITAITIITIIIITTTAVMAIASINRDIRLIITMSSTFKHEL